MAVFETANYRNVALVGHTGSGKTSLAEAMLFKAGMTTRLGSVTDGTSILDASEEEREHKSTIESAIAFFEKDGIHINVFDTPGVGVFCGQSIATLAASELAVVVVSAASGIEVNTRKMLARAQKYGLGIFIVVNHISATNADLEALVGQLQESFGGACTPINLPKDGGQGVVDCLANDSGEADFSSVADANTAAIEAIVGVDDALMEKYLGGELSQEEVYKVAPSAVAAGTIIPILFTDACSDVGIEALIDALVKIAPSPIAGKKRTLIDGENETEIDPNQNAPFIGQVFRITTDLKSHIKHLDTRVLSGKLTSDMTIKTVNESRGVRPGQIMRVFGTEIKDVEAGVAGDVIALAKLDFHIGDVIFVDQGGTVAMPVFPKPMYSLAMESKSRGDEDKIGLALRRFAEEDACFTYERGAGGELLVNGMGEVQLRSYLGRMSKHYKLEVETKPPKIPYRETITGRADHVEYTHKKQSGGAGQFGRVFLNVYAAKRGEGYEFIDKIFGGAIDQSFRPSVDKGVRGVMADGVLAGYPVVDVKVELVDGKTHPVDSKDIAFQIAGRGAFREGFLKAHPVLLEPIVELEVTVPVDNVGDIQGDLASRRGRPQGQDMLPGNISMIKATVPLAELSDYNSRLSSITGGQGSYTMELSHYEVVPSNVQQQIVEQSKKEREVEATH